MYNALVIKNANFSTNKVTTVDFAIPCTDIKFTNSSITLNQLGTASIGYTVTPSNATDPVIFTSSNPSVISVSGTTLTAVGIGSCTLTATCGTKSDTCSVTVDVYASPLYANCNPSTTLEDEQHPGTYGLFIKTNTLGNLVSLAPHSAGNFEKSITFTPDNLSYVGATEAIKIPANTASIRVQAKYLHSTHDIGSIVFLSPNETFERSNVVLTKIDSNVVFTGITRISEVNTLDETVNVPAGATGYVVILYPDTTVGGVSIGDINTQAGLITFAENMELSIHYLPAS